MSSCPAIVTGPFFLIFPSRFPKSCSLVKLIVNIEIQVDDPPSYRLVNRENILLRQNDFQTIRNSFTHQEYQKLKKG